MPGTQRKIKLDFNMYLRTAVRWLFLQSFRLSGIRNFTTGSRAEIFSYNFFSNKLSPKVDSDKQAVELNSFGSYVIKFN